MTARRFLVLAAAVVFLDALTKQVLTTAPWAEHPRDLSLGYIAVGIIAPLALALYPPARIGAALLLGGVIGNIVWASVGPVPNPFITTFHATTTAFNLADVAIVAGAVWVCAMSPRCARDLVAWRKRRADGEHQELRRVPSG